MSTVSLLETPTPALPESVLADIVSGLAAAPGLWSGFLSSLGPARASVHLLATDAYDVWLIGWPAGTGVEPHDHGDSAGVLTVVQGALTEYRWSPDRRPRAVGEGEVVRIAAGVVHDVVADVEGAGPAVSIHAYSPPLRTMGFYADDGARLLIRTAVEREAPALSGHAPTNWLQ
jgi:quercetin dioxygenase-like cupin family protein